jgi:hypothetical protein
MSTGRTGAGSNRTAGAAQSEWICRHRLPAIGTRAAAAAGQAIRSRQRVTVWTSGPAQATCASTAAGTTIGPVATQEGRVVASVSIGPDGRGKNEQQSRRQGRQAHSPSGPSAFVTSYWREAIKRSHIASFMRLKNPHVFGRPPVLTAAAEDDPSGRSSTCVEPGAGFYRVRACLST